jgi:hypothetical protein
MWSLYQQARAWGTRPSDLFEIPEECGYLRWCFDEAVLYFGRWVQNKLDMKHQKGPNKGRPLYTEAQLLCDEPPKQVQSVMALMALGAQGGVEIR